MDKVALLPPKERSELFSETSAQMNIDTALIEKDFWVCWILKLLFSKSSLSDVLLFNGGTSLSKIYSLIRRFSEDIDLAVDWKMLGYDADLAAKVDGSSRRQREKLFTDMLVDCRGYISGEFITTLREEISEKLPAETGWLLEVDPINGDVVNFKYPTIGNSPSYVQSIVRLELGTQAEREPKGTFSIKPYAAEHFPKVFDAPECQVNAIVAERTFWEKITILHKEHFRTKKRGAPGKYSRHYYDVYMITENEDIKTKALNDLDLLERVVAHKNRFFYTKLARYDLATPSNIQLLPSDDWLEYLKNDYEKMQIMLYGSAPSFSEILERLVKLESEIRSLAR